MGESFFLNFKIIHFSYFNRVSFWVWFAVAVHSLVCHMNQSPLHWLAGVYEKVLWMSKRTTDTYSYVHNLSCSLKLSYRIFMINYFQGKLFNIVHMPLSMQWKPQYKGKQYKKELIWIPYFQNYIHVNAHSWIYVCMLIKYQTNFHSSSHESVYDPSVHISHQIHCKHSTNVFMFVSAINEHT